MRSLLLLIVFGMFLHVISGLMELGGMYYAPMRGTEILPYQWFSFFAEWIVIAMLQGVSVVILDRLANQVDTD